MTLDEHRDFAEWVIRRRNGRDVQWPSRRQAQLSAAISTALGRLVIQDDVSKIAAAFVRMRYVEKYSEKRMRRVSSPAA